MEECLTKKTQVFNLRSKNVYEEKEKEMQAQIISEETGVPKEMIYNVNSFPDHISCWYKINSEWYFYKCEGLIFRLINELLGEVISEYFGLKTVHYNIAKTKRENEYGVISKNFCNPNHTYKRASDYNIPYRNDLSIFETLKEICKTTTEYENLIKEVKTFLIRDFYTRQCDRHEGNFLFEESESGIILAPLYDYEDSYVKVFYGVYKNYMCEIDLKLKSTREILKNDITFQKQLYKLMKANVVSFIEQVEDRHKIIIPQRIKDHYQSCEKETKALLLKSKIV